MKNEFNLVVGPFTLNDMRRYGMEGVYERIKGRISRKFILDLTDYKFGETGTYLKFNQVGEDIICSISLSEDRSVLPIEIWSDKNWRKFIKDLMV